MKNILNTTIAVLALAIVLAPSDTHAQSWSQCTDGRNISRCETYDCPKGDTNKDGKCTLEDTVARLTDSRNDSYCANPISGCGQVQYFPSGASQACVVRPEESNQQNCDLYAVAEPSFTPQPTASPKPTSSATTSPTSSARPTSSPTTKGGGDSELPGTGPEHVWLGALVLLVGVAGVYLYEKHKLA